MGKYKITRLILTQGEAEGVIFGDHLYYYSMLNFATKTINSKKTDQKL